MMSLRTEPIRSTPHTCTYSLPAAEAVPPTIRTTANPSRTYGAGASLLPPMLCRVSGGVRGEETWRKDREMRVWSLSALLCPHRKLAASRYVTSRMIDSRAARQDR
ncbi:hypothetical protein Bbelb_007000 [Branchiostoma belcheri]|nr:hypothetical protein Bbelb_007000 [Branchiostoma belcheri]